jgi:type 1 glutamine amidotransferase
VSAKRVLIFGGEANPYHDFSIQGPLLARLAAEAGHEAELTCDPAAFEPAQIAPFDVISILASAGNLSPEHEEALLNAVIGSPWGDTGAPKGLLGIHGATVLTSSSGAYQRMLGARFLAHPPLGPFSARVEAPGHPVMRGVVDFTTSDELYLMEELAPFDVLLSAEFGGFRRPLAWVRPYGLGRVCYCALGHGTDQLEHESVRLIFRNALDWLCPRD